MARYFFRSLANRRSLGPASAVLLLTALLASSAPAQDMTPAQATPLDLVNALHKAFGEHHARAVHTKGVILEGTFTPAIGGRGLTSASIFTGGPLPIIARFSLFAGVPTLPDNDDGASPAGFAVKIKEKSGTDFDIEANQHRDFIVATSDDFRTFLLAAGAAGKGDKAPLETFLANHPHAQQFLSSRTYPVSYAKATYFGVNSVKFTNKQGSSSFVRYRFVPQAGESYLTADKRKLERANYLQDEVQKRVAREPIVFDWYAQISGPGDKIEDPSIAWPESRRLVKLGTFKLTRMTVAPESEKTLLFLPGQVHKGV